MSEASDIADGASLSARSGWQEFWRTEDWWAVWLGLGLTALAYVLFVDGSSLAWLAVLPPKWASFAQLGAQFVKDAPRYVAHMRSGWRPLRPRPRS